MDSCVKNPYFKIKDPFSVPEFDILGTTAARSLFFNVINDRTITRLVNVTTVTNITGYTMHEQGPGTG